MTTESDILKAKDPVDKTRDLLSEISSELTEKKARKIFELPFTKLVNELDDDDLLDSIFNAAVEESTVNGKVMWAGAFNCFASILELIKLVRIKGSFKEGSGSSYADEVQAVGNPIAAVYSLFRKHKEMSEAEGKALLELGHHNALLGLSNVARDAVFGYASDRGVSWLEIASQYDAIMDIVRQAKRPIYEEL